MPAKPTADDRAVAVIACNQLADELDRWADAAQHLPLLEGLVRPARALARDARTEAVKCR